MEDEFTTLMHSELFLTPEEEISERVYCVVLDLEEGGNLEEALDDYDVTLEQYNKYKAEWT